MAVNVKFNQSQSLHVDAHMFRKTSAKSIPRIIVVYTQDFVA
jgi:hypothetical protein